jgi:GTP-binding protein
MHRVVAIVGRPNVGKSAIFNRLARRRIAIVHAESGVTRDRLMREVAWGEERFELIDTGGVFVVDDAAGRGTIEGGMLAQVRAALQDAAVVVLVVDVETGLTPMDIEVARIVRQSGRRAFVAVNKADHPGRDDESVEFEQLGFQAFPVSALHDRGFEPLMDAVIAELPEEVNPTLSDPLRVAVVGRPNVGKSSYINRLLRSERVIVSDAPGTTRDSIDIPFTVGKGDQARHYILADTAGIRRTGKVRDSVEHFSRFRAESAIKHAEVVILTVDASTGVTAQDKRIASKIAGEHRGCVVLVNKWDLAGMTQRRFLPELERWLPFLGHCPVVFASAKTGYNIRRSIDAIDLVASQVRADLPTGMLNRVMAAAYERVNPPALRGQRLKIFYVTQVDKAPIRLRVFVNEPRLVRDPYKAYLLRCLREHFGLEGAPVVLQFRHRREGRRSTG